MPMSLCTDMTGGFPSRRDASRSSSSAGEMTRMHEEMDVYQRLDWVIVVFRSCWIGAEMEKEGIGERRDCVCKKIVS